MENLVTESKAIASSVKFSDSVDEIKKLNKNNSLTNCRHFFPLLPVLPSSQPRLVPSRLRVHCQIQRNFAKDISGANIFSLPKTFQRLLYALCQRYFRC